MDLNLNETIALIITIGLFLIGIFMLLVVIGAGQLKTPEERELDDIEQIEYLRKYDEKKYKK